MTYDKNRDGMFWQPLWDLAFIVLAVMPITSMEQRSFSYYRIDWWVVEQDKEDCPAVQHIAWFFFSVFFFSVCPCILDIITSLFIQLNAQLDCSRNVKTCIKIYFKILLHVSV